MKTEKFLFINRCKGYEILRPFMKERDVTLLAVLDETEDFKYTVREILIPEWMDAEEYAVNHIKYLFSVECGYREEMGEEAYRQFCGYCTASRLAIYELLATKKFKSSYRKSLRTQVDKWLAKDAKARRYSCPLTYNQMSVLHTHWIIDRAQELDMKWRFRHYLAGE